MNALQKTDLNREFEELWQTIRDVREAAERLDKAADKVIEHQQKKEEAREHDD